MPPWWCARGGPSGCLSLLRRSHGQAQRARDVVIAAGADPASVTAASDPGLSAAALLSGDLDESRQWVREVLGPLSSDTDSDARLRETLRVFLRSGASYKSAEDRLHMHSNSVKYRVRRATERRGRPVGDARLDVEIALLICQWFGRAVLLSWIRKVAISRGSFTEREPTDLGAAIIEQIRSSR